MKRSNSQSNETPTAKNPRVAPTEIEEGQIGDARPDVQIIFERERTVFPTEIAIPENYIDPKNFLEYFVDDLNFFTSEMSKKVAEKMENAIYVKKEIEDDDCRTEFFKEYSNVLQKYMSDETMVRMAFGKLKNLNCTTMMNDAFGKGSYHKDGMMETKFDFLTTSTILNETLNKRSQNVSLMAVSHFFAKDEDAIVVLVTKALEATERKETVPAIPYIRKMATRYAEFGKFKEVIDAKCDALTVAVFQNLVEIQRRKANKFIP